MLKKFKSYFIALGKNIRLHWKRFVVDIFAFLFLTGLLITIVLIPVCSRDYPSTASADSGYVSPALPDDPVIPPSSTNFESLGGVALVSSSNLYTYPYVATGYEFQLPLIDFSQFSSTETLYTGYFGTVSFTTNHTVDYVYNYNFSGFSIRRQSSNLIFRFYNTLYNSEYTQVVFRFSNSSSLSSLRLMNFSTNAVDISPSINDCILNFLPRSDSSSVTFNNTAYSVLYYGIYGRLYSYYSRISTSYGLSYGEYVGYEDGRNSSSNVSYQEGYESGYSAGSEAGYNSGFHDGTVSDLNSNPISYMLAPVNTFLSTKLFGFVSIGMVLSVVIFVSIALIFLRIFAGG